MSAAQRNRVALAGAVLGLAALTGFVGLAPPASAHASLVGTDPEQGALLDAAPAAVTLTFTEPMDDLAEVVVSGPDGADLADGAPVVDGAVVRQSVVATGAARAAGTWSIAYRATSADGHPLTGQVTFSVGAPTEPTSETITEPTSEPTSEPTTEPTTEPSTEAATDAAAPEETASAASSSGPGLPTRDVVVPLALLGAAVALWLLSRRLPAGPPS